MVIRKNKNNYKIAVLHEKTTYKGQLSSQVNEYFFVLKMRMRILKNDLSLFIIYNESHKHYTNALITLDQMCFLLTMVFDRRTLEM